MASQVGHAQGTISQLSTVREWTGNEKAALSQILGRVCALQRQYGKSPDDLETLVEGFAWALEGYPLKTVSKAIATYVRSHPDIPTPADIIKILDPPKKEWSPDWEYYRALRDRQKSGPYALGKKEIDYVYACEEYSLSRRKDCA